ncbi:MAG: PepSY domain-containing protein, partial [Nocardioides sp.]
MSIDNTLTRSEAPGADQPDGAPRGRTKNGRGLFRALWRWHFYGSFLVIPILLVLATSGLIYLFRFQIDPLFAGAMRNDLSSGASYLSLADQQAAVISGNEGAIIMSVTEPRELGDNTRFVIATADEAAKGLAPWEMATQDVYVNPATGELAGTVDPNKTVSGYALRLHSELMVGPKAERIIELGACWAVVMALTGYY